MVSIMSSMSFWTSGDMIAAGSMGLALSRSTGCPMPRDFQNRHSAELYCAVPTPPMSETFRFCPSCGGSLATRSLKSGDPDRLVCERCGFVFYLDPKVAVGTIIADAEGRIVLVKRAIEPGYGKWVFPGGYVDRGELVLMAACGKRERNAGSRCGSMRSSTSIPIRGARRS